MSNLVRLFFDLNKKCFEAIAKIFPQIKNSAWDYHFAQLRDNLSEDFTILDVGGGRSWHLNSERERFRHLRVITVDPSEDQLKHNHDADKKILFAMGTDERLPVEDNSVDIAMSNMVLEHIENNDYTMREIFRVLKPGGKFFSVMPNKFALFAMINQMLPNWLARKILFTFRPETKGSHGFKAYYDRTYYPAMKKLLIKHGFSECEFFFSYHQSFYFAFFLPFGLIALLWDFIMYMFRIKPLCAYLFFAAVKKSS